MFPFRMYIILSRLSWFQFSAHFQVHSFRCSDFPFVRHPPANLVIDSATKTTPSLQLRVLSPIFSHPHAALPVTTPRGCVSSCRSPKFHVWYCYSRCCNTFSLRTQPWPISSSPHITLTCQQQQSYNAIYICPCSIPFTINVVHPYHCSQPRLSIQQSYLHGFSTLTHSHTVMILPLLLLLLPLHQRLPILSGMACCSVPE